jgi:hypothetical protein
MIEKSCVPSQLTPEDGKWKGEVAGWHRKENS